MKKEKAMSLLTKSRPSAIAPPTTFTRMRDEIDRVFDRFVRDPLDYVWQGEGRAWLPALYVTDGEAEVTIKAEVPGMAAKDVDVSISGNLLTLSGHKEEAKEEKGENFYVRERRFGSFHRSIELPEGVDSEKVSAEQDNGVLTVKIPKLRAAKPKHIPVKATIRA
jgi:HSP20 family protein